MRCARLARNKHKLQFRGRSKRLRAARAGAAFSRSARSGGLFLSYTRHGANNDHITRNRAPLFLAEVDSDKLHVIRATEQVLIPERGVMLGNFGAAAITADESWVTDAEFIVSDEPHPRGADGSVFSARVNWSRPNRWIE